MRVKEGEGSSRGKRKRVDGGGRGNWEVGWGRVEEAQGGRRPHAGKEKGAHWEGQESSWSEKDINQYQSIDFEP